MTVDISSLAKAVTTLDRQGRIPESFQPDPPSAEFGREKSENFERLYLCSQKI
jgi:hypothetical protein